MAKRRRRSGNNATGSVNQSGGNSWGTYGRNLGSFARNAYQAFIAGGYMPPSSVQGSWLPLGNNSGSTTQRTQTLWGNVVTQTPVNGGASVQVLIESLRLTNSQIGVAPPIQVFTAEQIDGSIEPESLVGTSILSTQIQVQMRLHVGMYIANIDDNTGLYPVQDPANIASVSRDNWIYLEAHQCTFSNNPVGGAIYALRNPTTPKLFDLYNTAFKVRLDQGQALLLSVNATDPHSFLSIIGATQFQYSAQLRALISRAV